MRLIIFLVFLTIGSLGKAQTPSDAALCFYEWYLQAIKGPAKTHTALVKKGTAGQTILDYQQYFQQLDSLDCVSEKFKASEQARFQSCLDYFKDIPYLEYYDNIDNNPNFYDAPCPFFTQYYWVSDMERWESPKVLASNVKEGSAEIQLELASGTRRQKRLVFLKLINGKWKIIGISQGL